MDLEDVVVWSKSVLTDLDVWISTILVERL
jgi:hypothetical protein